MLMFKVLVLQALYSLSDEATEFEIKDRLPFQRFLGLGLDGRVPDATTAWLFKERLVKAREIKDGRIPDAWQPAKARLRDRDARWAVKFTEAKVKEGADRRAG